MNAEQLNQLHSDRANWKLGIFYSCAEDPRPIVRSGKVGWTMNCAKPLGWILIALFFGTIIGLAVWMRGNGMPQTNQAAILLPALAVWLLVFHMLSTASRFSR
jgi:hypothetical protein